MTEPTHEIRRDVAALLDMSLASIMLSVGIDELETAREKLREQLADAWHQGWMAGHDNGVQRTSPVPNPYSYFGQL